MIQIIKKLTYIPVYVFIISRIDSHKTEMQVIVVFCFTWYLLDIHTVSTYTFMYTYLYTQIYIFTVSVK